MRHVFYAPLTAAITDLVLNEGWDLGLVTPAQIHQGQRYSQKAGQNQPLASPHRQILLDFIHQAKFKPLAP